MDGQNNAETMTEIIVSSISSGREKQPADVVLAVLSTVLPSIERDNITSISLLRAEKQDDGSPTESRSERRCSPGVVCLS